MIIDLTTIVWFLMLGTIAVAAATLVGMAVHSLRHEMRVELMVAKRREYILYWRTLAHLQRRLRRVEKMLEIPDEHDEHAPEA